VIIIIQPVLPSYRVDFFSRLADRFGSDLLVYVSEYDMGPLTDTKVEQSWLRWLGPFRPLFFGLAWQTGTLQVKIAADDIVVVSGNPRNLASIAMLLKAKAKGARTIWWGHYWSATSATWRFALRLVLMRLADGLMLYTDNEIADYLASPLSQKNKPTFALNNGIETREIFTLRKCYDAQTRADRLLFIGRITSKAQLNTLLLALSEPECEKIELHVIGSGRLETEAKQLAVELGIQDRVCWHGGIIDQQRIADIANECKAFVYPGSVGLSLIHGLAYGLPALIHEDRWYHNPECAALVPEVNGRTFKRGNAVDLSKTIRALFADSAALNLMSEQAIATIETSFNANDMAARFASAINQMRSKKRA
jgi:glycosyltransferase involved in cell wall biosynthesis